jgi:hypothetical protein
MLSKEVKKAAWKDTSLWLAMIQPRSKPALSPGGWITFRSRFQNPAADAPDCSADGVQIELACELSRDPGCCVMILLQAG